MGFNLTLRQYGISVVICCYNSSSRIQEVFNYLFHQNYLESFQHEFIVVDNSSTDDTSKIVEDIIINNKNFVIKLLYEEKQGLSFAREKGINESKYELILFVDDDNFLNSNYLKTIYDFMLVNMEFAACGGYGIELIRETEKPIWFERFKHSYAVGYQKSSPQHSLYGAGMCIRYSALKKIYSLGFLSLLSDRKGNSLTSGGDVELILAFVSAGFEIKALDKISFYHLIPSSRLSENYLKRLYFGFGLMYPILMYYRISIQNNKSVNIVYYYFYYIFFLFKSFIYSITRFGIDRHVFISFSLGLFNGFFYYFHKIFKLKVILDSIYKNSKNF